ncbi:uncharacterized protein LOC122666765 [Telopea speciosissima]|uniref:uncharacterized protein LOC122666765 n=1 Tax=Telopea speciosissima TaxID=54955 RepID=UPI001CC544A7|nr:uncharacterized protein LOC122666765 [Telopea speciosissima]
MNVKLSSSSEDEKEMAEEDRFKWANGIESSSSSDDEESIRSIFCLKNNVSMEEFDKVEDCYILEFDPFEKLTLKNDDAEELSVTVHRSQVACLDYPHSRHLCAKFPFYKTPHEDYCEQCYCYVCDSAAPCKSWKSPGGHCDATEHDELWKNLRRRNVPAAPAVDW